MVLGAISTWHNPYGYKDAPETTIDTLVVAQGCRNAGLSAFLINAAVSRAERRDDLSLYLVDSSDRPGYYAKFGFEGSVALVASTPVARQKTDERLQKVKEKLARGA